MFKQLNWFSLITVYVLAESALIGAITWTVWHFILKEKFGFEFNFLEITAIIFISKLIINNMFAISSIAASGSESTKADDFENENLLDDKRMP